MKAQGIGADAGECGDFSNSQHGAVVPDNNGV